MLTAKELMQLEDFLTIEQSCVKTLNYLSNQLQGQSGQAAVAANGAEKPAELPNH